MSKLSNDGERMVPGASDAYWYFNHLARYVFARRYVQGKLVLDAGSGEGYGAAELKRRARRVVGIDVDQGAIAHAQDSYAGPSLSYALMDARKLGFREAVFDVITSFEMFEHIEGVEAFIKEAGRVLKKTGTLVVSTPNKLVYPQAGVNPFHVREYSVHEFEALLRPSFKKITLYGQKCNLVARDLYQHPLARFLYRVKRVFGISRLLPRALRAGIEKMLTGKSIQEASLADFEISKREIEKAEVIIAVCNN